jgi:PhnB protein
MKRKPASIPKGYHTITPYFSVRKADRLIAFLKKGFGGKAVNVMSGERGEVISAEVHIGDSIVFVGEEDGSEPLGQGMRGMFYMYVRDVDAAYKKAVQAGAKSIQKPADQFWGDRSGTVEDIAGNRWWIAAHQESVSSGEVIARAAKGPGEKPARKRARKTA